MGGAPSEKPDDKDVIYAELDEDVIKQPSEEHPIKNDYAPGDSTIRGATTKHRLGPIIQPDRTLETVTVTIAPKALPSKLPGVNSKLLVP